jgi:hypothetical protein
VRIVETFTAPNVEERFYSPCAGNYFYNRLCQGFIKPCIVNKTSRVNHGCVIARLFTSFLMGRQ